MAVIRVMLVDDSSIFLGTLKSFLQRIPALTIVATAQNGLEALQLIQETQPQVMILDMNMPQMNGLEVLDELRQRNSPAQVLVLSAYSEKDLKLQAFQKGAAAYVDKGDLYRLLTALQMIVDKFLDA